jgi:hypothetical protein
VISIQGKIQEYRPVRSATLTTFSLRDIQKTLRSLFPPDYSKCYRKYRPSNDADMYRRIDYIRRCKKGRISKHAHNGRNNKSIQRKIAYARRSKSSGQWTWPDSFEGPADAFRRYNTIDEQVSLANNCLVDSQPVVSNLLMLDGSVLQSTQTSRHIKSDEPLEGSANPVQEANRRSGSLRSLQSYLAKRRSPNYSNQVTSVLRYSSSDSWRSSLTSLSSVAPSAQHVRTSHSLTIQETEIWDEIIDEEKLGISQGGQPKCLTASLCNRICCITQENPIGSSKTCKSCGLTFDHRRALQISALPGVVPGYDKSVDFYGNTMLHCLAATIPHPNKLWKMRMMILEGASIHARNTSGENFLHLLCENSPPNNEEMVDFLHFLAELSAQGFSFLERDHHGRIFLHILFRHIVVRQYSVDSIKQLFLISKLDLHDKDNSGTSIKDLLLSSLSTQYGVSESTLLIHFLHDLEVRSLSKYENRDLRPHGVGSVWETELISSWVEARCQSGDLNYIDKFGDAPLGCVIKNAEHISKLEEIVGRFITAGVGLEMRDRKGDTALSIAAQRGLRLVVVMLLKAGANVHTRNSNGRGVLREIEMALTTAKSEGKDELYAKILTCLTPLCNAKAKLDPTEQDELMSPDGKRSYDELKELRQLSITV